MRFPLLHKSAKGFVASRAAVVLADTTRTLARALSSASVEVCTRRM
jgi:hypothetical protein